MNGIEKWWQHLIQGLSVLAVVYFAHGITQLKTSDAITQVKLDTLQTRIGDFSQRTADRYTKTEAMEDLRRVVERLSDFEKRIRELENRRYSP